MTQKKLPHLGFPVGGGANLVRGADSRCAYILKNLYVKTKELGPLRGRAPAVPPFGSANDYFPEVETLQTCSQTIFVYVSQKHVVHYF